MCDAIVEHPIVDVPSAGALALTFKNARLVIIPRSSRSVYSLRQHKIYHGCAPNSGPLIYFVPMLIKELSALKRVQPSFIEPMYAEAVRVLPDGGLWTYEAKLDGYRCLAAKRSGRITLWSRRGNGFTHRFPKIAQACEKLPHDTLIDGEVVALDEAGRVSFNALQHSGGRIHTQQFRI